MHWPAGIAHGAIDCVHDMRTYVPVGVSLDTICSRLCDIYVASDPKSLNHCWFDCREFHHDYLTTVPS